MSVNLLIQLIGRGGRDGSLCRAHILTHRREIGRCKDSDLEEFCTSKENCRREILIKALGSEEHTKSRSRCCDVCTPSDASDVLLHSTTVKRQQQRKIIRNVSSQQFDELKRAVERERDEIISADI